MITDRKYKSTNNVRKSHKTADRHSNSQQKLTVHGNEIEVRFKVHLRETHGCGVIPKLGRTKNDGMF